MNMEEKISGAIVRSYFKKLENNLSIDVAIVGAGPSGLVAARDLGDPCNIGIKESEIKINVALARHSFGISTHGNYRAVFDQTAKLVCVLGLHTKGAVLDRSVSIENIKADVKFIPASAFLALEIKNLPHNHNIANRLVNRRNRNRLDRKRLSQNIFG